MSPRAFPARSRLEIVDDDDRFTRPAADTASPSPTTTAAEVEVESKANTPTRARSTSTATKAPATAKAPAKKAPATKAPATKAPATKGPAKRSPARGAAAKGAGVRATPRRSTSTKAPGTKAAAPAPAAPDPGSFTPAPRVDGMGTSAIQAYVRQDLRDRVNGVVTAAQLDEDLAGLDSLTAFVEWALDRAVTHVEKTFNRGEAYPPPRRLRKAPLSR